jgi:hypothetical protein
VQKDLLTGLPEATELEEIITRIYTGRKDLSFVDGALTELGNAHAALLRDISELEAGKPARRSVWNEEWDTHKRKPKPKR